MGSEAHVPNHDQTRLSRIRIEGDDVPDSSIFSGGEVVSGLRKVPKEISSIFYYDDRGSTLFEQLCAEPSYYLTRTEESILEQYAPAMAKLIGPAAIVELGCGNGRKSRLLVKAFLDAYHKTTYMPIDINRAALVKNARSLLDVFETLAIKGVIGTYESAIERIGRTGGTKCFAFLGSTIGNMGDDDIGSLLEKLHRAMGKGDSLLLGIDLDKDTATLEAAYNNQTAILTNLCVLQHLNWRFGGDFDLFKFRHVAFHNVDKRRIESHLEATESQIVKLAKLNFVLALEKGERIRTEISRKFIEPAFVEFIKSHGFEPIQQWRDSSANFSIHLYGIGSV